MKYELLLDDTKNILGIKRFRIKALVSFSNVAKGDLGGYIQAESNLSQSGNAWVYGYAYVYGNARVYGNALVLKSNQCVNINNFDWNITSLPKGVQVGCHFYSLKEWKSKYMEIGQAEGLTIDECNAYYELFKATRRLQRLISKRKS
ncbi:MAG: hypothetical protein NVS1B10_06350 [Candidatus Saccharimonadales bacterium]